jgi:hypothetical protein
MMKRLTVLAILAVLFFATPALAQTATDVQDLSPQILAPGWVFLPAVKTHFTFGNMKSDVVDYAMFANLRFDADLFSKGKGKVTFMAWLEGYLGTDGRASKLESNKYEFRLSGSYGRLRLVLVTIDFDHQCWHIDDKYNPYGVSFNTGWIRAEHRFQLGREVVDIELGIGKIQDRTYVDYGIRGSLNIKAAHILSRTSAIYGTAVGEGNDVRQTSLPMRDSVYGAAFEGGYAKAGAHGVAQFFVRYERRIDARTIERQRRRWVELGVRISSKK